MECLYAYVYLWIGGFCTSQDYNEHLDKKFIESSFDDVLLELEECSSDYKSTFARLNRYFEFEKNMFDSEKFGQILFSGLESSYNSGIYDIEKFASRCYELWKILPNFLCDKEPFYVLSYADDPLSWGDEEQTISLYRDVFNFYKNQN